MEDAESLGSGHATEQARSLLDIVDACDGMVSATFQERSQRHDIQVFYNEPDEYLTWSSRLPEPHHELIRPLVSEPFENANNLTIFDYTVPKADGMPQHFMLIFGLIWGIALFIKDR